MDTLKGFILGLVQGFTEFLPISSSGHLVLFQHYFKFQHHDLAFDMVVHMATLIAIFYVFNTFLLSLIKGSLQYLKTKKINDQVRFVFWIIIGTIPAGVIGLLFKDFFEQLFNNLTYVGGEFVFTATVLYLTKFIKTKGSDLGHYNDAIEDFKDFDYKKALIIGFAQAIAISPGISRSGMTIAAGLLVGLSPRAASVYSFSLSIPAILGAAVLMLKDVDVSQVNLAAYGVGFLASLISGVFSLLIIIKIVKKRKLEYFSYYLWVVGALIILFRGQI